MGKPIKFGTHVHLIHAESGYYCDVLQYNDGENHYQVQLSKTPSRSTVFIFESVHKLRSNYTGIQLSDNFKLFHEKTRMYLCLEPIKDKMNKATGAKTLSQINFQEDSTVLDYDLTKITQGSVLAAALQSTEEYWNLLLVKNSMDSFGKIILTNNLVRIYYPTFDTYLCADFSYEGKKENIHCDGYRGETQEESTKTKHIWICKNGQFGGKSN
jgi:hypothetical protein